MSASSCLQRVIARAGEDGLPGLLTRAISGLGFLLLGVSVLLPWFEIPTAITGPDGEVSIVARTTLVCLVFQLLCLATLLFGLLAVRLPALRGARLLRAQVALLVALLFFPCFVTHWSGDLAGEASWLQAQHDSLTAQNGDLFFAQEDKDSFWRHRLGVVNRPLDSVVVKFPDWGTHIFRWARFAEVTQWLGMSPWFAGFVRAGWPMAMGGVAFMIIALCRASQAGAVAATIGAARFGALVFAITCAVALIPPLSAVITLADAERAVHHARPAEALHALRTAQLWLPALQEDGRFLTQLGSLESELNLDTPHARYWHATQLDSRGFDLQARSMYLEEMTAPDAHSALRRECGKALLRQTMDAMNSAELGLTIQLVEHVLDADPCNLKALNIAQLAYLRGGDADAVLQTRDRIAAVYRNFNNPTKNAVIAQANENVALAASAHGLVDDAWRTWRVARRR